MRPAPEEYAPFFAGYVKLVPETDVLPVLAAQASEIRRLAGSVPAGRETFRYAPGKWSIREVFGHIGDAERVFGYRAFCISRGDGRPRPASPRRLEGALRRHGVAQDPQPGTAIARSARRRVDMGSGA